MLLESGGQRQRGVAMLIVRAIVWALLLALALAESARAAGDLAAGSQSRLPVPRFVSLKSDHVNVRAGPSKDQDVTWVYTRAGLPVEVTAEYENWRRIRDWEGAEGWVYHSLLSGRRTIFIAKTKAGDELAELHESADPNSAVVAKLEPGVLGMVKRCSGSVCRVSGPNFDGWVAQERLWGVYPNEKLE